MGIIERSTRLPVMYGIVVCTVTIGTLFVSSSIDQNTRNSKQYESYNSAAQRAARKLMEKQIISDKAINVLEKFPLHKEYFYDDSYSSPQYDIDRIEHFVPFDFPSSENYDYSDSISNSNKKHDNNPESLKPHVDITDKQLANQLPQNQPTEFQQEKPFVGDRPISEQSQKIYQQQDMAHKQPTNNLEPPLKQQEQSNSKQNLPGDEAKEKPHQQVPEKLDITAEQQQPSQQQKNSIGADTQQKPLLHNETPTKEQKPSPNGQQQPLNVQLGVNQQQNENRISGNEQQSPAKQPLAIPAKQLLTATGDGNSPLSALQVQTSHQQPLGKQQPLDPQRTPTNQQPSTMVQPQAEHEKYPDQQNSNSPVNPEMSANRQQSVNQPLERKNPPSNRQISVEQQVSVNMAHPENEQVPSNSQPVANQQIVANQESPTNQQSPANQKRTVNGDDDHQQQQQQPPAEVKQQSSQQQPPSNQKVTVNQRPHESLQSLTNKEPAPNQALTAPQKPSSNQPPSLNQLPVAQQQPPANQKPLLNKAPPPNELSPAKQESSPYQAQTAQQQPPAMQELSPNKLVAERKQPPANQQPFLNQEPPSNQLSPPKQKSTPNQAPAAQQESPAVQEPSPNKVVAGQKQPAANPQPVSNQEPPSNQLSPVKQESLPNQASTAHLQPSAMQEEASPNKVVVKRQQPAVNPQPPSNQQPAFYKKPSALQVNAATNQNLSPVIEGPVTNQQQLSAKQKPTDQQQPPNRPLTSKEQLSEKTLAANPQPPTNQQLKIAVEQNISKASSNVNGNQNDSCKSIKLMPKGTMPLVALLSSPGSGNTWTRFLIERATGIYTSSVYYDMSLYKGGLLGEIEDVNSGTTVVTKTHFFPRSQESHYSKVILLVRNPYNCILSEFNRQKGKKGNESHVSFANPSLFKTSNWTQYAKGASDRWFRIMQTAINTVKPSNVLVIYYESVLADVAGPLEKMVRFLGLPVDKSRLECTKRMSDKSGFHRPHKSLGFDPYNEELTSRIQSNIENARQLILQHYNTTFPKYEKETFK